MPAPPTILEKTIGKIRIEGEEEEYDYVRFGAHICHFLSIIHGITSVSFQGEQEEEEDVEVLR